MHTLRTRFKKEIVTEFLPPRKKSSKVIILCSGMPSVPYKPDLMEFFSKKGYWVFYPRYRGSWESGGQFLKISPHQDIIDVIDSLPKGFKDAWGGKIYKVRPSKICLFGGSFGGPAAILASLDKRVNKVIAVSPVVDWKAPSKTFLTLNFGPLSTPPNPAGGGRRRHRLAGHRHHLRRADRNRSHPGAHFSAELIWT